MLNRRRLLLLAPAGVLAVGLLAAAAALGLREEAAVPIGGAFALQDGSGRTVTEADFRGRWMLVYFGYTHCPDACPTALQDMADARDQVGPRKRDLALLFITVDPERDTPAVMRDYVASMDADVTALSGGADAIQQAARAYRVYYARHPGTNGGYDMDHSSIIYLMDPKGRFAGSFTHETPPSQIAAKLRAVM